MTPNERFARLAGVCWHEWSDKYPSAKCIKCGRARTDSTSHAFPDFTDAREVLKVMMEREDWFQFLETVGEVRGLGEDDFISIPLMQDQTGKLRDLAIRWMEGRA